MRRDGRGWPTEHITMRPIVIRRYRWTSSNRSYFIPRQMCFTICGCSTLEQVGVHLGRSGHTVGRGRKRNCK